MGPVQFGSGFPLGHPPDPQASNKGSEALASSDPPSFSTPTEINGKESFKEAPEGFVEETTHSMEEDDPRMEYSAVDTLNCSSCP